MNPEILKWARETAGLEPDEAAQKLGIREAKGMSARERIKALESGEQQPSRAMLRKMASQYRRSLVAFYLSEPPPTARRGRDFRTLPDEHSNRDEGLVDALIRDVRARQSIVRSALEAEDEAEALSFVGSASTSAGKSVLVRAIRETIGVSLEDFRRERTPSDAFAMLRARTEGAGVFVLLIGNLGSHHTALDVEMFRGFALADKIAPFIIINDQDSKAAWSFTLLHELAHIWLGQTGVSGSIPNRGIEQYCNDVASEFLLPTAEIRTINWANSSDDELSAAVSGFAAERNISASMVAYKLRRQNLIDQRTWLRLKDDFRTLWLEHRTRERLRGRERGGGPSFYTVRQHRIGPALLGLTARLLSAGAFSTSKAGHVLGVKAKQVGPLVGEINRSM